VDTVTGVKTTLTDDPGVTDAAVFRVGSPEVKNRAGVDAFVIAEEFENFSDTFAFQTIHQAGYIPLNQPISADTTGYTLTSHSPTFLIIRDESVLQGSEREQSRVVFSGDEPSVGETVTFTYRANAAIPRLQRLFEDPEPELFVDVLVKQAVRLDIRIDMDVALTAGADAAATLSLIETAVFDVINTLKIGESVDQSDVITAVGNVTGVDRVVLPLKFFGLASSVLTVVDDQIVAGTTEYLRITATNLNVVLVS